MAAQKKYLDMDVIAFLEERMKSNTKHYQSDFGIDTRVIKNAAFSQRKEDKTLLWFSRPMGTYCNTERETFIRDTFAYNNWRYFTEQSNDPIIAFAVELTGMKDGVIRGNLYELDFRSFAEELAKIAVPAQAVEKTFQDGYVEQVPMERSSYPYYVGLVEKHGPIVASRTIPVDTDRLNEILAEQTFLRSFFKLGKSPAQKVSLQDQINAAELQKTTDTTRDQKEIHVAQTR